MFVSTMPINEQKRIMDEADVQEQLGDIETAEKLRLQIPLQPKLANEFKKILGLQALTEIGFNLEDAVIAYGSDWLSD